MPARDRLHRTSNMDIQQEINLSMFRTFANENVSFAYPTREIILRQDGSHGE